MLLNRCNISIIYDLNARGNVTNSAYALHTPRRFSSRETKKNTPSGVTRGKFRLWRIFLLVATLSELRSALLAKCELPQKRLTAFASSILATGYKKGTHSVVCSFFGDPWENRTPVTAVKGRCLSRLTNGPDGSGNWT